MITVLITAFSTPSEMTYINNIYYPGFYRDVLKDYKYIDVMEISSNIEKPIKYIDSDIGELICESPQHYVKVLKNKFKSIKLITFRSRFMLDFEDFDLDVPINLSIVSYTNIILSNDINIYTLYVMGDVKLEILKLLIPMIKYRLVTEKINSEFADLILDNHNIKILIATKIDVRLLEHPSLEKIVFDVSSCDDSYFSRILIRDVTLLCDRNDLNIYDLIMNPNIINIKFYSSSSSSYNPDKSIIYIDGNMNEKSNIEIFEIDEDINWTTFCSTKRKNNKLAFLEQVKNNYNKSLFKRTKVASSEY